MKKEKTREVIVDSFYNLLKKHSFSKITTKMICEASGISKATFYRHFSDKYEVMNAFFKIRCDQLLAENPGTENCQRFLEGYAGLVAAYKDYFRAVLTTTGQNSFWDYLFDCGMSYYVENIEKASGKAVSDELRIQIELFTSGTVFVTRKWIEGGFTVPEKKIAEIVYRSMPMGMREYY